MNTMFFNAEPRSSKFSNISKGKIKCTIDGEQKEVSTVCGNIIDLDIADAEFEGREYKKLILTMQNGEQKTELGFALASGYGNAFVCISPNIDFDLPVTITPTYEKIEGTNKFYGGLIVSQSDKALKWYIKKNAGTKEQEKVYASRPQGEKKKDRNGEFTDYSKRIVWDYEMLTKKIRPRVLKAADNFLKNQAAPALSETSQEETIVDDLPF